MSYLYNRSLMKSAKTIVQNYLKFNRCLLNLSQRTVSTRTVSIRTVSIRTISTRTI